MSDKCGKDETEGYCCCNCRYHITDYHHCTTIDRTLFVISQCVCSVPKGWICAGPEGRVHSGWSEHGMCEMHELKVDRHVTGESA